MKDAKKAKMETALKDIYVSAQCLWELKDIGNALLEAGTMPSYSAFRTIVRTMAYRILTIGEENEKIRNLAEEALREPETDYLNITVEMGKE